jgi:hypothetical protein
MFIKSTFVSVRESIAWGKEDVNPFSGMLFRKDEREENRDNQEKSPPHPPWWAGEQSTKDKKNSLLSLTNRAKCFIMDSITKRKHCEHL